MAIAPQRQVRAGFFPTRGRCGAEGLAYCSLVWGKLVWRGTMWHDAGSRRSRMCEWSGAASLSRTRGAEVSIGMGWTV